MNFPLMCRHIRILKDGTLSSIRILTVFQRLEYDRSWNNLYQISGPAKSSVLSLKICPGFPETWYLSCTILKKSFFSYKVRLISLTEKLDTANPDIVAMLHDQMEIITERKQP